MSVLEMGKRGGDFLIHYQSAGVCFRSCTLTGPVGGIAAGLNLVGMPVNLSAAITTNEPIVATPTLAGDEASADGFIVSGPPNPVLAVGVNSGHLYQYKVLVKGPALVAFEGIAGEDVLGDALNRASLKTVLEALGVRVKDTTGLENPTTTTAAGTTTT